MLDLGLLSYEQHEELPTIPTHAAPNGADKYYGQVATGYEERRNKDPKWVLEQNIIEGMLRDLPAGTKVLDVPCGTGRFFEFYAKRQFLFLGLDKSQDMLKEAQDKLSYLNQFNPVSFQLLQADVRKVDELILSQGNEKSCPDVSLMVRLTRWLSPEDCVKALRALQAVTKDRIIFTARVRNHPFARTYELIESSLDGWYIYDDQPGVDMDYRIIQLRRLVL